MESATAAALSKVAGDVELEAQYNRLSRRLRKFRSRAASALLSLMVFGLLLLLATNVPSLSFEERYVLAGAAVLCFVIMIISLRSSTNYYVYAEDRAFMRTFESIRDLDKYVVEHDPLLIARMLKRIPAIRRGLLDDFQSSYLVTKNSIAEPSNRLSKFLVERFKVEIISGSVVSSATLALKLVATYYLRPTVQFLEVIIPIIESLLPAPGAELARPKRRIMHLLRRYTTLQASIPSLVLWIGIYAMSIYYFVRTPWEGFQLATLVSATAFFGLIVYLSRK